MKFNKLIIPCLFLVTFLLGFSSEASAIDLSFINDGISMVSDNAHEVSHSEVHKSEHHGPDTSALFFVIIAILIGAATRHFLKSLPFPFTVLLLVIGLILGVLSRLELFGDFGAVDLTFVKHSVDWAANICLLYTSPSPRDRTRSRMPSSA